MGELYDCCQECTMMVKPSEYHPYAACLMFKACHDSDTVRKNLDAVLNTRPITPLQAAEKAFIEAYRKWHNAEGAARMDAALVMGGAWNHLQQLEGESK